MDRRVSRITRIAMGSALAFTLASAAVTPHVTAGDGQRVSLALSWRSSTLAAKDDKPGNNGNNGNNSNNPPATTGH